MSSYKGLLWSLVAIAGTATAATVVYRYATRSVRDEGASATASGDAGRTAGSANEEPRSQDYEDEYTDDEYEGYSTDDGADTSEMIQSAETQQQLMLVTREGNLLLSVFGLVLMLLVGVVGAVLSWTSEEPVTIAQFPMFAPLMWIAIGIFTASSVDVLTQNAVAAPDIPVLNEKTVFPSDESDFELIDRYNTSSRQSDASSSRPGTPRSPTPRSAPATPDDEEEKAVVPTDMDAVNKHAEELFEAEKHQETYDFLKNSQTIHPNNIDVLWRLARACNFLVETISSQEEKKAKAFEGLAYAQQAYVLDTNSALANKWMGILTSTVGNFKDLKEKIAGAYEIRNFIQRAIELDPSDPFCHSILGQWCLAFANMTWIEKRAAAALFGTPPTATYDDAVQYFLSGERASPGFWKKNAFLLAETYHKMKQDSNTREWLIKAHDLPVKTTEDQEVQQEITALMKKLRMA
ncbi:hypothetical protein Poli38472_006775 [Pythium oligandrum]|uniref:Regulator of microtubule dynamics protein 1 n=1 Tax=Pythium oligandrum TaxID=41045 RepID=A0A8K1C5K6_PYTOL|nr:hypothetical protein Poli38472_006775 [Pythium oligandrum]|eukprot:TMW56765.1 hypothetical protein Poli38472_006775 [Pythium oligandrum]